MGKERYVFVIKDNFAGKGYRAVVYGQQIGEKLSEGNTCYLTGTTDKNGVIIVKYLYDPKKNVHADADRVYSSAATRSVSILCVLLLMYLVYVLSHIKYTTFSIFGSQMIGILPIIVLLALSVVCLKNRNRIVKKIGWILLAFAVFTLYPPIVIIIAGVFVIKKFLLK